jgi:hypothetical protein
MPHSTTLRLIAIMSISFALTACVGQNAATSKQNSGIGVVLGSANNGNNDGTINEEPVVQGVSSLPTTSNTNPEPVEPVASDDAADAGDTELTLTWQATSETLEGYLIYYGASPETVTQQISDIKAFSGSFDFAAPSLQYASWSDLGLQPGNTVCFKIRAYNADGMSDWSQAVCSMIPQKSA